MKRSLRSAEPITVGHSPGEVSDKPRRVRLPGLECAVKSSPGKKGDREEAKRVIDSGWESQ